MTRKQALIAPALTVLLFGAWACVLWMRADPEPPHAHAWSCVADPTTCPTGNAVALVQASQPAKSGFDYWPPVTTLCLRNSEVAVYGVEWPVGAIVVLEGPTDGR